MRNRTVPLGRIFNIPIGLDYSWFLIFGLLSYSLATEYFPARYTGWNDSIFWIAGIASAALLFVSVLLHELGHSLVARAYNIPVKQIRLMIFGGVAELGDEPASASAEFLIAVIGPVVSFVTAGVAGIAWFLLKDVFNFQSVAAVFRYLAMVNLMLAAFNMIPGFPLDGGRVLRAIVWAITGELSKATRIAARVGEIISGGFIIAGIVQFVTSGFSNGLWTVFIGVFLLGSARSQLRMQVVREKLSQQTVGQAVSKKYPVISATTSLYNLVTSNLLGRNWRIFLVQSEEGRIGYLHSRHLSGLSQSQLLSTTAGEIMKPIDQLHHVNLDTVLWAALKKMDLLELDHLPVMDNGQLYGLLRREDVSVHLKRLQQLTN